MVKLEIEDTSAWIAGGTGVVVTSLLAFLDFFWPAMTVLAGMTVSVGLVVGSSGRKRYVLAAVVYCLGLALLLEAVGRGRVPDPYMRSILPAVSALGIVSAILLGFKTAIRQSTQRIATWIGLDADYIGQLSEALSALGSLLVIVWLVLTWSKKVVRYGGSVTGAIGFLFANRAGYSWSVSLFGIEFEVIMVSFVGCLLILVHLLDTIHNTRRSVSLLGKKGADDDNATQTDGEMKLKE